jgi:MYXO-CTERM domain-containing protein
MSPPKHAALFATLALIAPAWGCSGETEHDGPRRTAAVESALEAALAERSTAEIIVNLRGAPASASLTERREHVRRLGDALLERYAGGFTLTRRFTHVPALAGVVTKEAMEQLRQDPDVLYLQTDGTGTGQLKEAVPAIGADKVHSLYGLTGRGVRVAILDTGVVTTHPDLRSSIVAQHCFTQLDCPPLRSAEGTSAEDDHGHGSNVAGIITSDGVVAPPGFAPNADIVAVKVDDANDSGRISDWVAGLDWVYDNQAMLKIKVVNMSICSTQLYGDAASCDGGQPALALAVKNLVDAGVTLFAASGNVGSATQMSAPACNTGVVAVGATYDSSVGAQPPGAITYAARWGASFASCGDPTTAFDQITCFTNSNARLDLVAPGAPMLSDSLNGLTETYWGTSQASPVGAGVAALMLECDPTLTPAEIEHAMTSTGVPRTDPKNGKSFPSLRALAAVQAVCTKADAGAAGASGAGGTGSGGAAAGGSAGSGTMAGGAASGGLTGAGGIGTGGAMGTGGIGTGGASGGVSTGTGGAPGTGAGGSVPAGGSSSGGAFVAAGGAGGAAGAGVVAGGAASASAGCNCTVPRESSGRHFHGLVAVLGAGAVAARLERRAKRRRGK